MRDPYRYSSFSRGFTRGFTRRGTGVGLPDPAGAIPAVGRSAVVPRGCPIAVVSVLRWRAPSETPFFLVLRSLAVRSWLSAPGASPWLSAPGFLALGYPSLAIRLGYSFLVPAPGPSLPGYPLRVSSSPRSHQCLLDSTSCHSPGPPSPGPFAGSLRGSAPRGVFPGVCSQGVFPRVCSSGASRGSLPRRRFPAHLPGRVAPGDASCSCAPRAGRTAPGRLPSSGLSLAPRFARADVAGSSHGGASSLLPIGRAPPGRRCSRRSAPRERRMPAGSGQAFRRCAQGDQPSTPVVPASPAVRDRSTLGPGGCRGGVVASKVRGGLPGCCCAAVVGGRGGEHGPVTGACPPGVPPSRSCPGTVSPAGLARREGTRGSRRGASGGGLTAAAPPRCRVPAARRGCSPHPATPRHTLSHPGVPCLHRGYWGALAAMIRGGGGYPPWRHTPGRPGDGASGGPRRIPTAVARIGAPRSALRPLVGPVAVMRHYTRRGCPSALRSARSP